MKLCRDCKHITGLWVYDVRCLKKQVSIVSGREIENCVDCRTIGECGPEGKLWEKKALDT